MTFLVRTLTLSGLFVVALTVSYFGVDPLGLGMLLFAAFVVVAVAWGTVDGRDGPALPAVVTWFLVALATGVVMPVATTLVNGQWAPTTLVRDTLATLPFVMVLVYPPALVGIAIGAQLRRRRTA